MAATQQLTLRFMRLCSERHVPSNLFVQWMDEYALHTPQSEHETYLNKKIEEIERDWPYIPVEQYLASIEESKDWDDLFRHRTVYWDDVPSMLADAVRTRSLHTIRQLALHCLFENYALRDEMLALAPDQRTKKALLYPPRLKEEEHYKQYPFCIKEHGIVGIHHLNVQEAQVTAISLPQNIQSVLFENLMKKAKCATVQQLTEQIRRDYPHFIGHRIFTLGYHVKNDSLVRKDIPECWLTDECMNDCDFPDDEKIQMGLSGLLTETIRSSRKCKFDGVKNRFGVTGYWYLPEW